MDIIKIGNDSMKISLCTDEANEYGFVKEESYEQTKTNFIRLLMNTKEKFNFKISGEKIIGEFFSGKDGGCEIFVSRVEVQDKVYKDKIHEEAVKKPRQLTSVFSFDDLEKLLMATKRLSSIRYNGTSSVYYDDIKEKYYIILEDVSIKELKYAFMSEYARTVKSNMSIYIKEHYKCICKYNGVKTLSYL